MPCYDKKLEAARDDFVFQIESHDEGHDSEINMISEVDSVLTTGEVLELIQVISLMHSLFFCHFLFTLNLTNDMRTNACLGSILQSKEVDFKSLEETPLDKMYETNFCFHHLISCFCRTMVFRCM